MEITCFALLWSPRTGSGLLFDVLIRRALRMRSRVGYKFQVAANNCDVSKLRKALGRQMTPECEMPLQLSEEWSWRLELGSVVWSRSRLQMLFTFLHVESINVNNFLTKATSPVEEEVVARTSEEDFPEGLFRAFPTGPTRRPDNG